MRRPCEPGETDMRQAIQTKVIAPTNTKGTRIKAWAQAGSITLHWDYEINADKNHVAAAQAFAEKLGWSGSWHGGGVDGSGYVFVNSDDGADFGIEKRR